MSNNKTKPATLPMQHADQRCVAGFTCLFSLLTNKYTTNKCERGVLVKDQSSQINYD